MSNIHTYIGLYRDHRVGHMTRRMAGHIVHNHVVAVHKRERVNPHTYGSVMPSSVVRMVLRLH
jgi:hypothetical protein